ncbi:MAG: CaiB/BaiF CoA transferase family protein [Hyphomicrobiales bacterium]
MSQASALLQNTSNGPLTGITVLDLSSFVAGPFSCSLLSDLGARVIKIESPEGDIQRRYPSTVEAESRVFLGINRGKRAISLNLKDDRAKQVFYKLVEKADVVVESFRPSVPVRLGIDYDTLRQKNPGIVYCSLTGFGEAGPMSEFPGYDQVLQTMSGMSHFQSAACCGSPQLVRGAIVDFYAAVMLALGITASLYQRTVTGRGEFVSTSLLAAALTLQAGRFVYVDGEDRHINRELLAGGLAAIHPTKDGNLYISTHTETFWQNLCRIIGLDDLASDPRFDSMRKRSDQIDEILPKVRAALKARPAHEWEKLMAGKVPSACVRSIGDMFDHPQVVAAGLVQQYVHPTAGNYHALSRPIQFKGSKPPKPIPAPLFSQHTDEILSELGWSAEELRQLHEQGVVQ